MLYLQDTKLIRGIPTATGFMPIGFPLIKFVIAKKNSSDYYKITWSNYHKQTGKNPGTFKLSYVTKRLPAKYLNDELSRRRDNPLPVETEMWKSDYQRLIPFTTELFRRFKEPLALEIIQSIYTHPVFREYYET